MLLREPCSAFPQLGHSSAVGARSAHCACLVLPALTFEGSGIPLQQMGKLWNFLGPCNRTQVL